MLNKAENLIAFLVIVILPLLLLLWVRDSWVFKGVDGAFYDNLILLRGSQPCSTMVLVAIDDSSLKKLGHWPWSRGVIAEGLNRIHGEKVIGIDIFFSEGTNTFEDMLLTEAISKHNVVLPVGGDDKGAHLPAMPFALSSKALGHVVLNHSVDGTIRKAFAFIPIDTSKGTCIPLFSIQIYRLFKDLPVSSLRYDPSKNIYYIGDLPLKLFKDHTFYINYLSKESDILRVPFFKLFTEDFDTSIFRDKIVLIGLTALGLQQDQLITPFSKNSLPMSGIAVQANIIEMLLKRKVVVKISETIFLAILIVLMGVIAWLMEYRNIYLSLSLDLLIIMFGFPVSYYLFKHFNIYIPYPELVVLGITTGFVGLLVRMFQLSRRVVNLTYFLKSEPIFLPSMEEWSVRDITKRMKRLLDLEKVEITKNCPPDTYQFNILGPLKLCISPEPSERAINYIKETFIPLLKFLLSSRKTGTFLIGGLDEAVKNLMLIEEKIQTQNRAFNILLNTVEGGFLVTDPFGNIVYLNERAARVFGMHPLELKGENLPELVETLPHIETNIDFRSVLLDMNPHVFGEITNRKTGETYGVGASFFRSEEGLSGLTVVFYDITRIKELLEAREFALYGLTHQFATPVTVIREYARLLKKHPEKINEKLIDAIINSANNLESLIHQFVYFSKLDRQTAIETFTEFDITGVIKREAEALKEKYPDKNLYLDVPDKLSAYGNPDMVGVLLNNLIDNGLKYSKSTVKIKAYSDGDHVFVEICDDGKGIPEEERNTIFDTFRRGRTRGKGFGLGLAIVKKIVELHRGEIDVYECPNLGGAMFKLRLPGKPPENHA